MPEAPLPIEPVKPLTPPPDAAASSKELVGQGEADSDTAKKAELPTKEIFGEGNLTMSATEIYKSAMDREKQSWKEKSRPMPENVARCLADLKNEYQVYFAQFGIPNIQWPEIIYTGVKLPTKRVQCGGFSKPGLIVISSNAQSKSAISQSIEKKWAASNPEASKRWQQFCVCHDLAHELFHGSSAFPTVIGRVQKASGFSKMIGAKDKLNITIDRSGLSYLESKRHIRGKAVEEGLAMIMEHRMENIIEKHFPKEMKLWHNVKESVAGNYDPDLIESMNPSLSWEGVFSYTDSIKLVKKLIEEVPNFERLAMRAHNLNETLALARAIEKTYGTQSYAKVLSAQDDHAEKLVKSLHKINAE